MKRLTCTVFAMIAVLTLTGFLFLYTRRPPYLPVLRGTRADVVEASYVLRADSTGRRSGPLHDDSIDMVFESLRDCERIRGKRAAVLAEIMIRYGSGEKDTVTVFSGNQVYTSSGYFRVNTQALVQELMDNGTITEPSAALTPIFRTLAGQYRDCSSVSVSLVPATLQELRLICHRSRVRSRDSWVGLVGLARRIQIYIGY